jgi:hypothetical protein
MQNEQGNQAPDAPATPAENTPIESFDDGVSRLEGLLGPDEDDGKPSENENQHRTEESPEDNPEETLESDSEEDTSEDTDEGEEESDTKDTEEAAEDGEDPLQFAEDTVVIVEGEEKTLGDIVTERTEERVKSFQADYTRKTQAAAERERYNDAQADKLLQYAENLKSQRDLFVEFQEQFTPQPPDITMVETDPIGYQQQKAWYDQWQETFNGFASQAQQARAQEAQAFEVQREQFLQVQRQKAAELVPELATPEGVKTFRGDIETWLKELPMEKVNNMADAELAPIIRDAIKYRKLEAKKPTAKKMLEGKPRILKPKTRAANPSQKNQKRTNRERLKTTGDLDDAVASLMDLDL